MVQPTLRSEECCSWCREPVTLCRDSSCDYTRTYTGVLRDGHWEELDEVVPLDTALYAAGRAAKAPSAPRLSR